jgi:hypothetical protein
MAEKLTTAYASSATPASATNASNVRLRNVWRSCCSRCGLCWSDVVTFPDRYLNTTSLPVSAEA